MRVKINGETQERKAGETLEDLVTGLVGSNHLSGVAVALDGEVVPRARWKDARLMNDSQIEILRAVAGG